MSANIILRFLTDNLSSVENEAASRACEPTTWFLKYLVVYTAVRLQCFPMERRKCPRCARLAKSARRDVRLQKPDAKDPAANKAKPFEIHALRNIKTHFISTTSVLETSLNPAAASGAFLLLFYGKGVPSKAIPLGMEGCTVSKHWCECPRVIYPEQVAAQLSDRPDGIERLKECSVGSEQTGKFVETFARQRCEMG